MDKTSKTEELDIAGLQEALSNGGDLDGMAERSRAEAEKSAALDFIAKNRSSQWDEDVKRKITKHLAFLDEKFPKDAANAHRMASEGLEIGNLCEAARKAGINGKKGEIEALKRKLEVLSPSDDERQLLVKKFADGEKKRKALEEAPQVKPIPGPDYDIRKENPHFLLNLKPSRHWFVAMDETGAEFGVKGVAGGKDISRGKYVAVLVPEESNLKRLGGGDHAMEANDAHIAKLLTNLYASRPYCGILGVTLDDMPAVSEYAHVNYWYNLIERTIDIILRLAPLADDGETRFTFLVEGRSGVNGEEHSGADMVERALHSCLYRLAKADSERERQIKAEICVEFKRTTGNADFRAYNGYADAIACAWAAKNNQREIANSLSNYGLRGTCLLAGNVQNLAEYLDNVHQGIPMSENGWTRTIESVLSDGGDSIPAIVLGEFGELVKTNKDLWKRYLDETLRHVGSHSIKLRLLGAQIEWLRQFMPRGMVLPPRLELVWLTIRLAHANHSGATESQMKRAEIDMARFRKLVADLYEEDAPLACLATLHLAVQATDSFEFERARGIVRDFLEIGMEKQEEKGFFARAIARLSGAKAKKAKPVANPSVMGLRYYGQLLSSLGQHSAFLGDNAAARDYFRQALDCFARLSDEKERSDEIDQTSAYLATAAMDDPSVLDAELRRIVESYLGSDCATAAKTLAVSDDPKLKYHHHILLRYFVSGRAPKKAVGAYLAESGKWSKCEDGHPWELIDFYRALLVDDHADKRALLYHAYENARTGGPTLQVIACVILNALAPIDPHVAMNFKRHLTGIRKALPALGADRLAALDKALAKPVPPLDLAKAVLPFNFR